MSQSFHQGIFGFSDAFDRQPRPDHQHQQQQATVYEPAAANNMLSEMFNFTPSGISAADLLANQIASAYRLHRPPSPGDASVFGGDWTYAAAAHHRNNSTTLHQVAHHMTGSPLVDKQNHHQAAMPGLNADSAAAMQLFLVDPQGQVQQQPRSPSPPSPVPRGIPLVHQDLLAATSSVGGGAEGRQGLSLSLSSPLQRQLEMEKAEEMRGRGGLLYYNNNPLQSQKEGQGLGGGTGMLNVLRHSKYSRAAQEVLAEFCNVGRGLQSKDGRGGRAKRQATSNPNISASQGGEGASSSCSSKDRPPVLSPSDRSEQQRRKAKLFSLVDKVDERYGCYREQMQKVVDSFDTAMGLGAATPYTGLAQKAMSRHFRSLKDAIATQLKRACELLGENYGTADAGVPGSGSSSGSGLTKGETPRLRILDRSLRRQRSFHYDRMEQEAWRPQRGLPERSVNMLRAWLFEHFLHPYPSDADKHLLARQTGLTRNQVSNWFINARVRLWKPMIEEMYLQEAEWEEEGEKGDQTSQAQQQPQAHEIPQCGTSILSTAAETKSAIRSDDQLITPSMLKQQQPLIPFPASSDNNTNHLGTGGSGNAVGTMAAASGMGRLGTAVHVGGGVMVGSHFGAGPVGFGAPGDVSLTLGLRHAPDNGGSGRYFNGR